MTTREFEILIKKYVAGNCTNQEKTFLESWYEQWNAELPVYLTSEELEEELNAVQKNLKPHTNAKTIRLWPRMAAACIAIGFLISVYLFIQNKNNREAMQVHIVDIEPGTNKAILTLANGRKIILGGRDNGEIAKQASVEIHQKDSKTLSYVPEPEAVKVDEKIYNTVTTPRGGQFNLVLADGTKVWLNAASSIRYPANFTGLERRVEISGEVYFEVFHNADKPFKVLANNRLIEDIGTHFNVNCYKDETLLKTTLLEGSIRVYSGKKNIILKPGQQSQINQGLLGENITVVDDANLDEAVSWKNSIFKFHNASIETIMRQLSRWYDVDVKYEHSFYNKRFTGEISREVKLSKVLEYLKFFNIDLRVDQNSDKRPIIILK